MNATQNIDTRECEYLGRAKPQGEGHTITAGEHFAAFWAFSPVDVWTADGWLVTAVQNDGVTHHLRKGSQACRRIIDRAETLHYYKVTASIAAWREMQKAAA